MRRSLKCLMCPSAQLKMIGGMPKLGLIVNCCGREIMTLEERHQKEREIFLAVLELEAERRIPFVTEVCAGDDDLRKEVLSLLENADKKLFDSMAATTSDDPDRSQDQSEMKYCPECQRNYPKRERFCQIDNRLLSLYDTSPSLVGRTLMDKYRLDALVGMGGFGAVYCAHHLKMSRNVAFKILRRDKWIRSEWAVKLFEREAKLAGSLGHENIVTVYD